MKAKLALLLLSCLSLHAMQKDDSDTETDTGTVIVIRNSNGGSKKKKSLPKPLPKTPERKKRTIKDVIEDSQKELSPEDAQKQIIEHIAVNYGRRFGKRLDMFVFESKLMPASFAQWRLRKSAEREIEEFKHLMPNKSDHELMQIYLSFPIDDLGNTALHRSTEELNLSLTRFLILHGAKTHVKNLQEKTPYELILSHSEADHYTCISSRICNNDHRKWKLIRAELFKNTAAPSSAKDERKEPVNPPSYSNHTHRSHRSPSRRPRTPDSSHIAHNAQEESALYNSVHPPSAPYPSDGPWSKVPLDDERYIAIPPKCTLPYSRAEAYGNAQYANLVVSKDGSFDQT